MIPAPASPDLAALGERLGPIRDRLARGDSPAAAWAADLRKTLEAAISPESDPGGGAVADSLRRLSLMLEVWDCLGAEGGETAGELPGFFEEALDRLIDASSTGDPTDAAGWILRRSGAGWGEYLALLDPGLAAESSADAWVAPPDDPPVESEAAAADLAALLRTMAGLGPGAEPAPSPASEPPAPPAPRPEAEDVSGAEPSTQGASAADLGREAAALRLDPEICAAFAADASDLLARIQELVLGLGGGEDARLLHELGRCYHTLKGAAGSVGLIGLATDIHDLEDRLELAGGHAPAELCRRLEGSLAQIESVLGALAGPGPNRPSAGAESGQTQPASDGGDRPAAAASEEPDGLIRVPAERFEELMDHCSELLTRRRAWSEQAERMKHLAATARLCSHRLRMSVDRLGEASLGESRGQGRARDPRGDDLVGLIRRMTEQSEDLTALAATAREAAIPMAEEAESLSRLSLRLWESLQAVRIVPVRGLFRRLIRVARDAARVEGREIEVVLVGEDTSADRLLLDKAYEPLLHIVRNAVGHGVEAPPDRVRLGKPPVGRITLEARREANSLRIAVEDDGRGLDHEAILAKGRRLGLIGPEERPGPERLNALIFQSGFSTRADANAISGRGVGMDVVAREVEALRGRIELTSRPGQGTRLAIQLPARLSLEHVMVVRVGGQAFAVPTSAIDSVHQDRVGSAEGGDEPSLMEIGGRRLPVVDLKSVLGSSEPPRLPCPTLLVEGAGGEAVALRVDSIDGPLELVIRPLGPLLAGHPAITGAGLTTGGEIVPALDVSGLLKLALSGPADAPTPPDEDRPRALVVDDSLSVRRVATRNLQALGLEVDEAADGEQALGKLRQRPYRLILTDLEMPRMDGFALLAELGRTGTLGTIPVVVTSTLADPETRRRVLDLGARAYVTKPVVAEELAGVVESLLAGPEPRACRTGSPC